MTNPVGMLKKVILKIGRKAFGRRPTKEERRTIRRAARKEERGRLREQKFDIPATSPAADVPVVGSLPSKWSASPWLPPNEARKELRNLAKKYSQVITEATALHDIHSLTPGRSDWATKWHNCQGKRILYFANVDFSGSFYKWADAVNRHTKHAVRMVSLYRHRFGYPLDLLLMRGDLLVTRFPEMLHDLLNLVDEADIIHIKDQTGFLDERNALPKTLLTQFRKPIVYTLYGGFARRDESDPIYQRHVKSHAAVVAMTPDLCFDWCESVFVPHNIDEDAYPFTWRDGLRILHTPSTTHRKGTDIFQSAAARIASEIGGHVDVITNTKHEYVMRCKPHATLFFDQAGREADMNGGKTIGWYGNSALESAVFGVPTMAHLSIESIERAQRAGYDVAEHSAILNVDPTEESLYQIMRDFFDRTPAERQELAERTRAWIERHHSYKSTARQLAAVYDTL